MRVYYYSHCFHPTNVDSQSSLLSSCLLIWHRRNHRQIEACARFPLRYILSVEQQATVTRVTHHQMAPTAVVPSMHTMASWEFVMTPATLSPLHIPAARSALAHLVVTHVCSSVVTVVGRGRTQSWFEGECRGVGYKWRDSER